MASFDGTGIDDDGQRYHLISSPTSINRARSLSVVGRGMSSSIHDAVVTRRPLVDDGLSQKKKVERKGQFSVDSFSWWGEVYTDPFHCLVDLVSFPRLVALFFLVYCIMIMFFTALFYLVGNLARHHDDVGEGFLPDNSFWTCFQCAWQSVTTVGYGTTSPDGILTNIVAAVAVIVSVVVDAVGIGMWNPNTTIPNPATQRQEYFTNE